MMSLALLEIERSIRALSLEEQLWLLERIARNLQEQTRAAIQPLDSKDRSTVFLCFQLRSLDPKRFPTEPSGQLSDQKMLQVEAAVRYCLGLSLGR